MCGITVVFLKLRITLGFLDLYGARLYGRCAAGREKEEGLA